MGGEKSLQKPDITRSVGSPPRGRGKDAFELAVFIVEGITPAWAGKRLRRCCTALRRWDHPRVGGEKVQPKSGHQFKKGSPPRGRGKVLSAGLHDLVDRITPAWAGKSGNGNPTKSEKRDHPRVGGEKFNIVKL